MSVISIRRSPSKAPENKKQKRSDKGALKYESKRPIDPMPNLDVPNGWFAVPEELEENKREDRKRNKMIPNHGRVPGPRFHG
jgi:hypothetical protein